jgi:hypothetical protein
LLANGFFQQFFLFVRKFSDAAGVLTKFKTLKSLLAIIVSIPANGRKRPAQNVFNFG